MDIFVVLHCISTLCNNDEDASIIVDLLITVNDVDVHSAYAFRLLQQVGQSTI